MKNVKITFVEQLSDEVETKMRTDLIAYESSHGIDVNYKTFSLVLNDDKNNILGILNAFTAFAEVYVDDLWVDKAYRGQGYGRTLLQALENHFKGKGFNNMNLVTSAFQAPEFYQKCGFEVEFVRKNHQNPKLTKTFLIKYFNEEVEIQGILQKKKI